MIEIDASTQRPVFAKSPPVSKRLSGKEGEIMLSARKLFEERGVAATSIKTIAAEAGLTRELVYYYFSDKQAIIEAVFDDFVEDLVETAMVWNEFRLFGDTRGSLAKCVEAFRRSLEYQGKPRPMFAVLDELGRRDEFRLRAVRETVEAIDEYVVTEYAAYHKIEIDLVYESFCLLIFGMVGLIRMDPNIPNETLMKLVEQVLHLDMAPIKDPYENTDEADRAKGEDS